MEKNDIFPAIIWFGIGIFVVITSYKLNLGTMENPGPGMMPFIFGIALSICSLPILFGSFQSFKRKERQGDESIWSGVEFKKIILVLVSLFVYALLFEKIGFLLTTFPLLLILFKTIGSQKWRWVLISSVVTMSITYFLFVVFLKVELPMGLFWL